MSFARNPKPYQYQCAALLAAALLAALSAEPLLAAGADREVAVWALHLGGFVVLEGGQRRIRDVADLPQSDFRIEVLNLVGANIHPPHMEPIGKLTALKESDLPGTMWNPRAEFKTDYHDSAAYLNGLTALKKLTFSLTFLISIHFEDRGLDKFQNLGPTLETLDLSDTSVTGALLDQLQGMKQLKSLFLAGAKATAERVERFRGLVPIAGLSGPRKYKEVKSPEDTRLIG